MPPSIPWAWPPCSKGVPCGARSGAISRRPTRTRRRDGRSRTRRIATSRCRGSPRRCPAKAETNWWWCWSGRDCAGGWWTCACRDSARLRKDVAAPGFQRIEQRQLVRRIGVPGAQLRDRRVEVGQVRIGQGGARLQAQLAPIVPALALGGREQLRPVAGAIAEQQFGQPGILESEVAPGQRRRW